MSSQLVVYYICCKCVSLTLVVIVTSFSVVIVSLLLMVVVVDVVLLPLQLLVLSLHSILSPKIPSKYHSTRIVGLIGPWCKEHHHQMLRQYLVAIENLDLALDMHQVKVDIINCLLRYIFINCFNSHNTILLTYF